MAAAVVGGAGGSGCGVTMACGCLLPPTHFVGCWRSRSPRVALDRKWKAWGGDLPSRSVDTISKRFRID